MKNKKNNGFTLIELLAVILILGVIALIAVPSITKIIDKARKSSYESSALGYVTAVERQVAINQLDSSKLDIEDGTYTIEELKNNYSLNIKGQGPNKGYINIVKGQVVNGTFDISNNLVAYSNSKAKVKGLYTNKYIDAELNGTDPKISGDLVPVIIEDGGEVRKADINNMWYNYALKKWANAVILEDKTINYNNNDVIPEENIESYFVWIPRYRYKLWNTDNYTTINEKPTTSIAQEIEIIFEDKEVTRSNGDSNGEWLTHIAFTSFETNGIWVGKFETSGTTTDLTIKPNVTSLRNQTVGTFFTMSYNYQRDLDSHMMKNTEWGAVAYLSHSKYGINKEININNNSSYKTGYSAVEGTDQSSHPGTYGTADTITRPYDTETGYKASTTGNITGIYDMSGGTLEYMASYSGVGSSELDVSEYNSKYFDVYSTNSTNISYQNRILGDATGEMGPFYIYVDKDGNLRYHNNWYADEANFAYYSYPWFYRGGYYGVGVISGQFYFNRNTGAAYPYMSSRLVLSVN